MTTVEFRGINKYFPGVKALDDISFTAESGKVYAFLGENGAGKSTLLKIMNGDYIADNGQILINSEECNFENPKDALKHGISVIYQERQILKEMTVAENVFLGDWIRKSNGFIDYEAMNKKTAEISKRFGLDIEPDEKVSKLSIAYQQMIEIMKAINRNSEIIAFDEPTAALSDKEIKILFSIIEKLKEEGKVIFYVSHRMNEISEIADDVIVFKDGCLVGVKHQKDVTEDELIRMMVGRPLGQIFDELDRNEDIGDVCLEFKNVTTDYVDDVSFVARKGEVLGFAGLVGAGRTEIMNAVFGIDEVKSGEILLNGKPIVVKNPEQAINYGIALVPEDRKDQGILPNISVQGNISISILKSLLNKFGSINEKKELEIANEKIKKLNIKGSWDFLVGQLEC
jgi:ABC-type sugar transport system ATPase subunit